MKYEEKTLTTFWAGVFLILSVALINPAIAGQDPFEVSMHKINTGNYTSDDVNWTEPITGMKFIWVPGGCFMMGSASGELDEKPVHKVCVNGFWIGKYEVTQGQWKRVKGDNPSYFKRGDNYPVESVSRHDVESFLELLNANTGKTFTLPTEAQWEYAASSGGKSNFETYSGGSAIGNLAWYNDNSDDRTHEVGTKAANGLGIYDMSGNVWEWCRDWYDNTYYVDSMIKNPTGPEPDSNRVCVFRGGGWYSSARDCRSANRCYYRPVYGFNYLGCRLVISPDQ